MRVKDSSYSGSKRQPEVLQDASGITSSSFPHWIQAPAEGLIVPLALSAQQRHVLFNHI